jgi:hypothetical protein
MPKIALFLKPADLEETQELKEWVSARSIVGIEWTYLILDHPNARRNSTLRGMVDVQLGRSSGRQSVFIEDVHRYNAGSRGEIYKNIRQSVR